MSKYNFETDFRYFDRESKADFVFRKYRELFKGRILDVGADQCFLRNYLPRNAEYFGVGLGENEDLVKINLEKEELPFENNSFDCVLCLDVLEHLENIHEMFDKLCKLSKKWVIVSLPNPWRELLICLQKSKYLPERNTKFYGLPLEKEGDRHKWFYSSAEAKEFVRFRSEKNNMEVFDLYIEGGDSFDGLTRPRNLREWYMQKCIRRARKLLFRKDLYFPDLYEGTMWWVLRKKDR